jgi:hypothetical protein
VGELLPVSPCCNALCMSHLYLSAIAGERVAGEANLCVISEAKHVQLRGGKDSCVQRNSRVDDTTNPVPREAHKITDFHT